MTLMYSGRYSTVRISPITFFIWSLSSFVRFSGRAKRSLIKEDIELITKTIKRVL